MWVLSFCWIKPFMLHTFECLPNHSYWCLVLSNGFYLIFALFRHWCLLSGGLMFQNTWIKIVTTVYLKILDQSLAIRRDINKRRADCPGIYTAPWWAYLNHRWMSHTNYRQEWQVYTLSLLKDFVNVASQGWRSVI